MRIIAVAAGLMIACAVTYAGEVVAPIFVKKLIKQYLETPKANPPTAIWRYSFKGSTVYYIPPSCCDRYGQVFNNSGELLCAPDGGITV